MLRSLFLLFNHQFTPDQVADAKISMKIGNIREMPPRIREIWGNVPPDLEEIDDYLGPVKDWLANAAKRDDHVLIQGDFGACVIMVRFAFENRLVPVYSTTRREAVETGAGS